MKKRVALTFVALSWLVVTATPSVATEPKSATEAYQKGKAFRDGQRAIDHVTEACELTNWKF